MGRVRCPSCGSDVPYQGRGRPRWYCSARCRLAARRAREAAQRAAERQARMPSDGELAELLEALTAAAGR